MQGIHGANGVATPVNTMQKGPMPQRLVGLSAIEEYQAFWEEYSRQPPTDPSPSNSNR